MFSLARCPELATLACNIGSMSYVLHWGFPTILADVLAAALTCWVAFQRKVGVKSTDKE